MRRLINLFGDSAFAERFGFHSVRQHGLTTSETSLSIVSVARGRGTATKKTSPRKRGPANGARFLEIDDYDDVLDGVVAALESARRSAARSVNAIMTATYWEIGRRIFEQEQGARERAGYGEALVERLSKDLSSRFGRGFGRSNLFHMRTFYVAYADNPWALPSSRNCSRCPGRTT